jgi:hypothetical protein
MYLAFFSAQVSLFIFKIKYIFQLINFTFKNNILFLPDCLDIPTIRQINSRNSTKLRNTKIAPSGLKSFLQGTHRIPL